MYDELNRLSTAIEKQGTSVVWRQNYSYDHYGNRSQAVGYTSSEAIRQKFTGYERDVESGLDFAQARYYANTQGRFISADSVGGSATSPQTLNRYSYTGNNPLNNVDPSGHAFFSAQFNSSPNDESGGSWQSPDNAWGGLPSGVQSEINRIKDIMFDHQCAADAEAYEASPPQPDNVIVSAVVDEPQNPAAMNNVCMNMAINAQDAANAALDDAKGDVNQALTAFDGLFSTEYVGKSITGIRDAASFIRQSASGQASSNGGSVHPSLPGKYFGSSGFPGKFLDSYDGNADQTHHFVAYFSAGINGAKATAKTHLFSDLGVPLITKRNQGDVNLSRVAYSLGNYLRNKPGRLSDIGALINTNICLGRGGR